MPWKRCVSTSTLLTTPLPPEMCAGTGAGACPHRAPHLQHVLWRVPPSLEPPVSLSWHRDGAELRLCRVWVRLHLHPPACAPAPPRACFSRASVSLALHGEQAPAMPPSPKPPGAALARGRDPVGPVGCGLGPRHQDTALRDSHAAGKSPGGSAAPPAPAGLRLRLAERAGGSRRCCLRCLSGQGHPSPAAKPQRCSRVTGTPWESLGTGAQRDW